MHPWMQMSGSPAPCALSKLALDGSIEVSVGSGRLMHMYTFTCTRMSHPPHTASEHKVGAHRRSSTQQFIDDRVHTFGC